MCIPEGSLDLYTSTCPMCVIFRHNTRCPHKRETCRNRAAHPRHDVSYITNAEVQTFNGCGFCKWAKQLPPPPASKVGMSNPGWPGCCRPPAPSELALIPPADWQAVHTIHRTPIPPEVKAILDAIRIPYAAFSFGTGSTASASSAANASLISGSVSVNGSAAGTGTLGAPPSASSGPGLAQTSVGSGIASASPSPAPGAGSLTVPSAFAQRERKSLVRANSSPGGTASVISNTATTAPGAAARTGIAHVSAAVAIPQKARERGAGSPQSRPSSLGGSGARAASLERTAMGTVTSPTARRVAAPDKPLKRVEGFRTTPPSGMRKLAEAEFHDRGAKKDSKDGSEHGHGLRRRESNASSTPLRLSASSAARVLSAKGGETRSRSSSKSQTVANRDSGEKDRARGETLDLEKIVAALSLSGSVGGDKHARAQSIDAKATAKSPGAALSPTKSVNAPEKARSEIGDGAMDKPEKNTKAASVSGAAEKPTKAGSSTSSPSTSSNGSGSPPTRSPSSSASSQSSDARSVSSGGSGSGDGSTITSDGGFTDYLSDESEAELQRQAVERAALLEQNRMEEAEFRLARQQLAHVDLRPPHTWTTGVGRKVVNAGYLRG